MNNHLSCETAEDKSAPHVFHVKDAEAPCQELDTSLNEDRAPISTKGQHGSYQEALRVYILDDAFLSGAYASHNTLVIYMYILAF